MARPGHLGDDDAVLGATNPGRVRLQEGPNAAQIERSPPPAALAAVIAGAAPPALSAATLRRPARANGDHDALLVLVELDTFDDNLL
jgi:hypothetical protein